MSILTSFCVEIIFSSSEFISYSISISIYVSFAQLSTSKIWLKPASVSCCNLVFLPCRPWWQFLICINLSPCKGIKKQPTECSWCCSYDASSQRHPVAIVYYREFRCCSKIVFVCIIKSVMWHMDMIFGHSISVGTWKMGKIFRKTVIQFSCSYHCYD
jgi:hypothetical protein